MPTTQPARDTQQACLGHRKGMARPQRQPSWCCGTSGSTTRVPHHFSEVFQGAALVLLVFVSLRRCDCPTNNAG